MYPVTNDSATPITSPPSIAPGIEPIPPTTAAVNALSPAMNPIVLVTWLNSSPPMIPATPARAEPRKNVAVMTKFTLIPSISAATRAAPTAPLLPPQRGPVDQQLQAGHQQEAQHQDQDLHAVDGDRADLDAAGQRDEVRGVVDAVLRAGQQEGRALQEERDADRGDQRRDPRRVAQRPVGEPLDGPAHPPHHA